MPRRVRRHANFSSSTSQTSKSTVPAPSRCLLPPPPKTRPAFLLSATSATQARRDTDVAPFSHAAGDNAVLARILAAVVHNFSAEVARASSTVAVMTVGEVVAEAMQALVAGASAGRTTTSQHGIAMRLSTSKPTGSFSRRSTSTGLANSTLMPTTAKISSPTASCTIMTGATISSLSSLPNASSQPSTVPPTTSQHLRTPSFRNCLIRARLPSLPRIVFCRC